MITAQQARAGRALLNWSQKELAAKCGVSLNAINNFEREIVAPRQDTLLALRRALEEAGLEFIGDSGVNKARDQLRIEEHHDGNFGKILIEDMIMALKRGAGDICFHGIDQADFARGDLVRWEGALLQAQQDQRVLLPYGNFNFPARERAYRWAARETLGEVAFVTYGDNLAILLGSPFVRLIVIRSHAIARTFRDQFEIHWAGAREPSPEQHVRGWEEFHGMAWELDRQRPDTQQSEAA